MRCLLLISLLACSLAVWAQNTNSSAPQNSESPAQASVPPSKSAPPPANLEPPRSDRVYADELSKQPGTSSSKDTQIDLSPPVDDAKAHPKSAETVLNEEESSTLEDRGSAATHRWDPHKAAKDVEVGDFYFKRKNYRAAEDRYREALLYKDNDAVATLRLAICLEKLNLPGEAIEEYESYLRILPHGPESEKVTKAVERLKTVDDKAAK
jgi:tetratricopeptide (TPR) repeat protein